MRSVRMEADMSQDQLLQVKKDLERLANDVGKLVQSDCTSGSHQDEKSHCHQQCGPHTHPLICLGITALLGGVMGAIISRK